jgi:NLR family CARD domain-containing protein 3
LNLSKNYLGNYCASRLKEFLITDTTLQELYLHWTELGTKATKVIFEGLAKNNGLKVLDISWNQIGMDGIRPFCNCRLSFT